VALRYFNAAGADPDGELGKMHDPETHLISLALLAALGRQRSIKVRGTDYPTPDGTCVRDYVHVSDLADAHVSALDWLAAGSGSSWFNLGNGRGFP
jgi:UDP-glucose 4-epimerase